VVEGVGMSGWRYPDARGWIGIGSFVLTVTTLAMILFDRTLLRDDFFKVIATAVILNGWNSGPVAWAYAATKGGGELADKNADIVRDQASAARPKGTPDDPISTEEARP
jgi:hypothetical protein